MTGNDNERQALADRLLSLPLQELVDVLRRVLPSHGDNEGVNGLTRRLVLAEATVYGDEVPRTPDDPAVDIEVVAWPDLDYHDGGFGPEPDLSEHGRCRRCDVEVSSTAKRAFCPICGERCHLT